MQGWGECVMSLGYGFAEGSSMSTDSYRATFSGTSSASPMVAAAAGIVSSVAQANGDADGLTSTEARALLVATGTPQDTSPAALIGNIGPLPNLAAALGLSADVSITKAADADPVVAGEGFGYEIAVTNTGPDVATDVVVTDALPADLVLVAADPACTPAGADLVCELGTLGVGDVVTLDVDMAVPADLVFNAGGPVTVTNTATVTSTIDDPSAANNTAAVDVEVVAVADLEVVSTDVVAPPIEALVGDDVVIKVRSSVANSGPSSPMNADLTTAATPSAGMSVDPPLDAVAVSALAVGAPQLWDQLFTVQCTAPGPQSVVFETAITPGVAVRHRPRCLERHRTGHLRRGMHPANRHQRPTGQPVQPHQFGQQRKGPGGGVDNRGRRVRASASVRRDGHRGGLHRIRRTAGRSGSLGAPPRDGLVRTRRQDQGRRRRPEAGLRLVGDRTVAWRHRGLPAGPVPRRWRALQLPRV